MSILYYKPSLPIFETGRNVRSYVANHMDVFWDIFKPLMPYIFACLVIDQIVSFMMGINPETGQYYESSLGEIISMYFTACLMISWHRVIIHGPDQYKPVNPLRPEKRDFAFMGMAIGLFLLAVLAGAVGGGITALIHPAIFVLFLVIIIPVAIFFGSRASFYFPSKATGADLSLGKAFALSKGYVWKLITTPIIASWKFLALMAVYMILAIGISFVVYTILGTTQMSLALASNIYGFLFFTLPMSLFFNPVLTIIGITVLSNYYQYALQNPAQNGTPSV